MYESRHAHLLPIRSFVKRTCLHIALGFVIILFSLGLGMIGYAHFENMEWIDAYLNASMILSGMGPVDEMVTRNGKIFSGTYAIFCGVVFLVTIAIIIAPLFHRFLHRFMIKDVK